MARRRLPVVLTDEELEAVLAQVRTSSPTGLRTKAMLKVLAYGGLRVSELVALTTKDLRREKGRVTLEVRRGKGDRDRTVPLADHVAETLEAWLRARRELGLQNGALFCTMRRGRHVHPAATTEGLSGEELTEGELTPGHPLSVRYVQDLVRRVAEQAGLEKRVTPHVLRHTAATRTLRAQGDLRRVQELLGHANVATTQIYTHVAAVDLEEAVDLVPDVEKMAEAEAAEAQAREQEEAQDLAAQVLAALPEKVRLALEAQLAGARS